MYAIFIQRNSMPTLRMVQRKQIERDSRDYVHVRHLHAKIGLARRARHMECHLDATNTLHAQMGTIPYLDKLFSCWDRLHVEHVFATADERVACAAVGPKLLSTNLRRATLNRQNQTTTILTLYHTWKDLAL